MRLVTNVTAYEHNGLVPGIHLGMPSPTLTVVVSLGEPLRVGWAGDPAPTPYRICVGGLHTSAAAVHHGARIAGIQLALTPGGARALLGVPAGELAHRNHELDEILGDHVRPAYDLLNQTADRRERIAIVRRLLSPRMPAGPVDRRLATAWCRLLSGPGSSGVPGPTVREVAAECGWSTRQFTDRFTREFGVGPKTASSLARFSRARRLVQSGVPAARVAALTGYTDQPHLIREWRSFTGTTPGNWPRIDHLAFVQDDAARAAAELGDDTDEEE